MVIKIIQKLFLSICFFPGGDNDIEAAKEYIKKKYLDLVPPREKLAEKNVYPHFTCSVGKSSSFIFYLIINLILI